VTVRRLLTREVATDLLHVFVLFGFAVTQPLLGLLSRIDAFDLFLRATPATVLLLLLILSVVLPGLAVGLELLVGLWSERLRRNVHALLFTTLVGLFALSPLRRLTELHPLVSLSLVGAAAVAACLVYLRVPAARLFVTFLAPSILVFPVLFLSSRYVWKVAFLRGAEPEVAVGIRSPTPVVLVVFDELPITSLMDERRRIDPALYPNFAALAEHATWYRDVTAVSDYTMYAVPAILSGTYPSKRSVPTFADYPRNLFTLLGGSHELHVYETQTFLCPESVCRGAVQRLKGTRQLAQLKPLASLYLDVLLPGGARGRVEKLVRPLRALRTVDSPEARVQAFEEFVGSIVATARPGLYFVHVNLPHFPWVFLPSGKRYPDAEWGAGWKSGMEWPPNDDLVLRGYQRHLLQVGFVDRLLGHLLERLRSAGLYDRALIVVTADHGVSFRPGDLMRDLTETNYPDVLPVPLLIKAPYQHVALVSDRHVETVDVLPTIAGTLEVSLPWSVDGKSAVGPAAAERASKPLLGWISYDTTRVADAVARKFRLFDHGSGPERLWRIGPDPELIDRRASEIGFTTGSTVSIEILDQQRFEDVQPDAAVIPALVSGRVRLAPKQAGAVDVAVATNGVLRAVARVTSDKHREGRFSVLVPERGLQPGRNEVEAFIVESGTGGVRLARARHAESVP
jgi:hypothetical protein